MKSSACPSRKALRLSAEASAAAEAFDPVTQAEKEAMEAMEKLAMEEQAALGRMASILADLASKVCTPRYVLEAKESPVSIGHPALLLG